VMDCASASADVVLQLLIGHVVGKFYNIFFGAGKEGRKMDQPPKGRRTKPAREGAFRNSCEILAASFMQYMS
jgi:hypothetical protein